MTRPDRPRARLARHDGLPFADVRTAPRIRDARDEHGVQYRDRGFDPVTTLRGFLSQVLSDDPSCRDAVARIIAHRAAHGLETCSPHTAGYCTARGRLPTGVLRTSARRTAAGLQAAAAEEWKWNGRDVFLAAGSYLSRPDTPQDRAAYPRPAVQRPGTGFPRARIAGLLSLASGAGHDLAIAPSAGQGTGATTPRRRMYDARSPGDVVLADALFDNYFLACELRELGLERVARAQAERVGSRTVEARPDGDVILGRRPHKPRGMTGEEYRRSPKELLMRQVTVDARDREDRAGGFEVVTTILDASIDGGQIGDSYERGWPGELDIRAIQATMQRDVLRCKSPEMTRKEIWAHWLAYNRLRTVMAVAAAEPGIEPRRVSFAGAKPAVTAVAPKLEAARPCDRPALIDAPLRGIAYHRVGARPGRWEPRAAKRRPKPGARLNRTRAEAELPENRKKWF